MGNKSITLMPVSHHRLCFPWINEQRCFSVNWGKFWFYWFAVSSITSPTTLKTRPRVVGPTGTVIGAPVSVATMPRSIPSVGPRAIQRTSVGESCWFNFERHYFYLTARMKCIIIPGKWSLNSTSTTGPIICRNGACFGICHVFPY